jgi:hypothetical protein
MKNKTLGASFALCALVAVQAALAALPAVEAPDSFERPGPVRSSIERMHETLGNNTDGNWKAQRAVGICADAARRLGDYVTSQVYTAELGEKLWDECHKAYADVE